jgi:hypothetical protein
MSTQKPDVGNLVGTQGEDFVEWICQTPFGRDFLFRGQQYRDGKNEIELCDLLLLLGDTAVLFEVKTAVRDLKSDWTEDQWAKWGNTKLEKAISQMDRGVKAIRSGLVKSVENDRQGRVPVGAVRINRFFGVAVVDHPTLAKWGKGKAIGHPGEPVSVLTTTHDELIHLVTELSTPSDFIDYLEARALFAKKHPMVGISELDILAAYKTDPEAFKKNVVDRDLMLIGDDCWTGYAEREERSKRLELDKYSFLVDTMLDILHDDRTAKLPHIEDALAAIGQDASAPSQYIEVATELARLRRIDRRAIGDRIWEKSNKCVGTNAERWFCFKAPAVNAVGFVFVISRRDRADRLKSLQMLTIGGKLVMSTRRVLGIVTEPIAGGMGFSVDAMLIDRDLEEEQAAMTQDLQDRLRSQFGPMQHQRLAEFGDDDKSPTET